jgi:C4-dicarboxylate transporter DctQ subunit
MARLIDKIISGAGYAAAYSVVLAMLITCYDVIARYFFNSPTLFAYDTSRWIYYYCTLLMAPWVFRKDQHIRIDIILVFIRSNLPRDILNFATSILVVIACMLLLYQGTLATVEDISRHMVTNSAIRIPRFLLLMSIPISSFLLSFDAIRKAKACFLNLVGHARTSTAANRHGKAV